MTSRPWTYEETRPVDTPVELWYGTIAETVGDFAERVMVNLPDFSPDHQVGPCMWQSRDDVNMPTRDDRCLVVFDNRGQPWVLAWWPFIS
jgi:hypothetical protein